MKVNVTYSPKRKRTVSAFLREDVLHVYAPAGINKKRLEKIIADLKARSLNRKAKQLLNRDRQLTEIAAKLNKKYFDNKLKIASIEYTDRQKKRYGSCNHRTRAVKISSKLKGMPGWVRDYVIVHEMAHLLEPNHGKKFKEIVSRYTLAERARGYLMAFEIYSR